MFVYYVGNQNTNLRHRRTCQKHTLFVLCYPPFFRNQLFGCSARKKGLIQTIEKIFIQKCNKTARCENHYTRGAKAKSNKRLSFKGGKTIDGSKKTNNLQIWKANFSNWFCDDCVCTVPLKSRLIWSVGYKRRRSKVTLGRAMFESNSIRFHQNCDKSL